MGEEHFANNWVHMFVSEIASKVVANSGIASDRFHLGKIILQSLKDDPDFIMQIDGATGQTENYASVLNRTVHCATSLRNLGLKKNDVLLIMAPSHLDLCIPFYAGWYLGLAVANVDRTMNEFDLKNSFEMLNPKIVFCQNEKAEDVLKVIKLIGIDTKVVTFDKSPHTLSFSLMLDRYSDNIDVNDFKPNDIDPEESIALLISTSGSTGMPKAAALTFKHVATAGHYVFCYSTKFPTPTRSVLLAAPSQWLSTLVHFVISPYIKYTRVQTSVPVTIKHLHELIRENRPTIVITSPTMLSTLMKTAEEEKSDFTCFEVIFAGGSAVSTELLKQIKTMSPNTIVTNVYGMSELGSIGFHSIGAPFGSLGQRSGHLKYRLVDVVTKQEIREPHKPGELWLQGPGVFKEYYNNPEATKEAFSADGWFMTGDLMYRDEGWNYYFADRIKSMLKYKSHQISPVELETVIRQHPGVLDVAVTGIPDPDCGDLAVACVVPRPGSKPTAEEIKILVKEKLSDSKQLRGGVLFLDELPVTPSTKINRQKIKQIVIERKNDLDLMKD